MRPQEEKTRSEEHKKSGNAKIQNKTQKRSFGIWPRDVRKCNLIHNQQQRPEFLETEMMLIVMQERNLIVMQERNDHDCNSAQMVCQEFVICGENDSQWLPGVPHNTNWRYVPIVPPPRWNLNIFRFFSQKPIFLAFSLLIYRLCNPGQLDRLWVDGSLYKIVTSE